MYLRMNCQQIRWSFLWVAPLQVEGVEFFETYAPVVQWSTVCALLVMSIVLNLATQQIDFSNAFYQAEIDEEVYVEMPYDFCDPRGRDIRTTVYASANKKYPTYKIRGIIR